METVFIYALNCPVTGRSRYVGKADNIYQRYQTHLNTAAQDETHKSYWLRSLLSKGLTPVLEVLDEVPVAEWEFWEQEWIKLIRLLGFDLTNQTPGGEGGATRVGKKNTPTQNDNIRRRALGRKRAPFSEEWKRKLGLTRLGRKHTEVTKRKIGMAHRGRKKSVFQIEKMRNAGKLQSAMRNRTPGGQFSSV